jgi:negative regulator of sigma E activity
MLPQTAGPVYSGVPSHQKTHPHQVSHSYKSAIQGMAQNIVSESSFLTAFDAGQSISQATPGDKRQ